MGWLRNGGHQAARLRGALAVPSPLSKSADPGSARSVADAMYTIALIAQKGGTGKITLAVHVAADFNGDSGSVALVNLGISPAFQHASATR